MPSNVEKMIAYLQRRELAFFHFTDVSNLDSIREHGLLSLRELSNRQLHFVPGGNQWSHDADRLKGVDGHVHLSLTPNHPMEHQAKKEDRIGATRVLRIRPEILSSAGARLTLGVANAADVEILEVEDGLLKLDFTALYPPSRWRDDETFERYKIARKGELLIPDRISPNMITNL